MQLAHFLEEEKLWSQGIDVVAGIDEVGRGCFAGPVVVGGVIFPKNAKPIDGVNDSKLISAKKRERLSAEIKKQAQSFAVVEISVEVINKIGIGAATQQGFEALYQKLQPEFILMDAFYIKNVDHKIQKPIIHGDRISSSIAAASIIAKVYRDNLMRKLHVAYPNYGFDEHKGYGTKKHREAIKKFGLCPIHRKSFNLKKYFTH